MSRLIFDIETDGLLDTMTVIHSLVIKDVDTGQVWSASSDQLDIKDTLSQVLMAADEIIGHNIIKFDIPGIQLVYPWFKPTGKITDTLILSRLIWPNLRDLDFARRKKLERIHGYDEMNARSPGRMIGSHGLEAWGRRLGEWKGDYSKEREEALKAHFTASYEDWVAIEQSTYEDMCQHDLIKVTKVGFERWLAVSEATGGVPPQAPTKEEIISHVWGSWNQEMQDYCVQDVAVTEAFLNLCNSKRYSKRAIKLEHDFCLIIHRMEQGGYPFDDRAADALERQLTVRKAVIDQELKKAFPPWKVRTKFVPKVNNEERGYVKDETTYKVRTIVFNPGSRDHVADRLKAKYKWKPNEFTDVLIPGTDVKKPKVDETILKALPWPEAALLAEYLTIQKRLGLLTNGINGWRKLVRNGRIYHSVNTNGAVTGRCTHSRPNLAQCPSVKIKSCKIGKQPDNIRVLEINVEKDKITYVPLGYAGGWGLECRSLFGPPKGMVQVGADLSGLELRCLAHFLFRFDGGAFAKELLEGDIHTANMIAAGLATRDQAKTFIYGFLYGAGAAKVGAIVGKGQKEGSKLIKQFLAATPALKDLKDAVTAITKKWNKNWQTMEQTRNPTWKGYLIGLDGRKLPVRHEHAALNTLLQSAGAIISKEATVVMVRMLDEAGLQWGIDYALMAHVHDEVQLWAKPEFSLQVGLIAVDAFEEAGRNFNFKCPITGEFKVGENWYECH